MPRPTRVGTTPAIVNPTDGSLDTESFTITLDASANCLLLMVGGYDDATMGPGTATITAGGSGSMTFVGFIENGAYSGAQYVAVFVLYDTAGNWPSPGSVTVTWVVEGGATANYGQIRGQITQWQDVDTAGTPMPDHGSASNDTTGAPSISLTTDADLDVMVAACGIYNVTPTAEAGVIGFANNGSSSSSLYVWEEDADGATSTIELAGFSAPHVCYAVVLRGTSDTAIGDLVQSKQNSGGTATITLDSAPTSGNLLIYGTVSGNSGVTLSTPPSGFTEITSHTAADYSSWWGWKISDGTETSRNHVWTGGNGWSTYAEYYWQLGTPTVQSNEDTSNVTADGSGPQSSGSVTPDDLTTNLCLAFITSRFQPSADGSGAVSNSYTLDVPFLATPTIAGTALASLPNASGSTSTSYSWSDGSIDTYGAIAAFSPVTGPTFTTQPTIDKRTDTVIIVDAEATES